MNGKYALSAIVASALFCTIVASAAAEDVVIKVWARADRTGPLRAGNLVTAGDTLNKILAAAGSDKRVKIELNETNAKGYDEDALDLLKAFAVDKGPDIFVLGHEWTGAFAEAGYAMNLEDHIGKNPELYGDIIVPLWQAVQKGVVKYGILHRPNAGPDFQMMMESFGLEPYDKAAAKLQASKTALKDFFTWVKYCTDKKAFSAANTAMSWDAIEQASFVGEEALVFFHGVWRVTDQTKAWSLKGKEDYQRKITWINAPAGKKGGKPSNLSHPIAYAVSAKSKNKDLAAYVVALASQPIPNMRHSVTTNHTPINYGGQSMPEVVDKGWALVAAAPMLKYASFMPNHPKIGQYNAVIFKGIQGVETGRLTAQAAADFVAEELSNELGKDVVIKN